MYNPHERAKKLREAMLKKRKEDKEYTEKQKEINKKNVEKRWKNEQNKN